MEAEVAFQESQAEHGREECSIPIRERREKDDERTTHDGPRMDNQRKTSE